MISKQPLERLMVTPEKLQGYYSQDRDDSPSRRIERMATIGRHALLEEIFLLNLALAEQPSRGGRTGEIISKSVNENGLTTTLGLNYGSDILDVIYPYVGRLGREIQESELESDEKLRRLATMSGVMIAQAQSFSVGNKRTARAMYGRITLGVEGVIGAHDAFIDFEPPDTIEQIALLQNVTRLRAEEFGNQTPDILGGVYVSDDTQPILDVWKRRLQNVHTYFGKSDVTGLGDADFNRYMLSDKLKQVIPDQKMRAMTVAILFQENYGPAAASFVFSEQSNIVDELDADKARLLMEVNAKLLRMRIMNLLSGLANGGYFTTIESGGDAAPRRINNLRWEPTVEEIK